MNRWKLRKELDMFFDENHEVCYGPRWLVTSPTGVSWGNYATHAEAMSRADKQARTVEVTLPRPVEHLLLSNKTALYLHSDGGAAIVRRRTHPSHTGIPKSDLKPLALALLAHHHKQEKQ
ncbi:hypothetical protein ACEN19_11200 [Corynebacterium auriscanis]|uniref:hypothetical protein n=1 Tax=Corynebacterium auriscanis TaxID=99807 RepID=UPI003CF4BBCE